MPNATLLILVDALRSARHAAASVDAVLREKRADFAAENAALIADATRTSGEVKRLETEIRELARIVYLGEGSKNPCPGVTIKLFRQLDYARDRALEWARVAGLALLPESLDVKAFEKIAAATPIDFVRYSDEPHAVIASDLDKALGGVGVVDVTSAATVDEGAVL